MSFDDHMNNAYRAAHGPNGERDLLRELATAKQVQGITPEPLAPSAPSVVRSENGIAEYRIGHFTITPSGLRITGEPEYGEWYQFGEWLQFIGHHVQMAIGDWINYGERRWGDKYSQAIVETGLDDGTLRNYAWVASKVDLSLRNDKLTFSHYTEIARLTDDKYVPDQERQRKFSNLAIANEYSVRELREAIKSSGQTSPAAPLEPPTDLILGPDGDLLEDETPTERREILEIPVDTWEDDFYGYMRSILLPDDVQPGEVWIITARRAE